MTTNIWQQREERFAAIAAKLTQPDWARRIAGVRHRLTPELCPRCLGLGVHLSGCSRVKRALVPALELAAGKAALRGERLMGALASALTCAWCGEPGTHADCIDAEARAEAEKEADRDYAARQAARREREAKARGPEFDSGAERERFGGES